VKVGREPFDESVRQTLEAQHPDVQFDWTKLSNIPVPAVDVEYWRERRRAEKAAKQARRAEEAAEAAGGAEVTGPGIPVPPEGGPELVEDTFDEAEVERGDESVVETLAAHDLPEGESDLSEGATRERPTSSAAQPQHPETSGPEGRPDGHRRRRRRGGRRRKRGGPLDAGRGGPLDAGRGGPLDVARGGPPDAARGGPLDVARGEPLDVARGQQPEVAEPVHRASSGVAGYPPQDDLAAPKTAKGSPSSKLPDDPSKEA
jgi:hypothetical protein